MKLVLSSGRTIEFGRRARRVAVAVAACTALLGASASSCSSSSDGAQQQTQQQTEQAFKQQSAAVPYPAGQLTDSLERRNLREKLLRYNNPSKISYLYLLSQAGGVYAYFTIKGKVSSNQSQMTTSDLIEQSCSSSNGCDHPVVSAPGDDGSYGANEDGEFAFTTDGVMVTWTGPYILTDAPMKLSQATVPLSYVDGSRPSSTGGK